MNAVSHHPDLQPHPGHRGNCGEWRWAQSLVVPDGLTGHETECPQAEIAPKGTMRAREGMTLPVGEQGGGEPCGEFAPVNRTRREHGEEFHLGLGGECWWWG